MPAVEEQLQPRAIEGRRHVMPGTRKRSNPTMVIAAGYVPPDAPVTVVGQQVACEMLANDAGLAARPAFRIKPCCQCQRIPEVQGRPVTAVHVVVDPIKCQAVAIGVLDVSGAMNNAVVFVAADIARDGALTLVEGVVSNKVSVGRPCWWHKRIHGRTPND